MLYMIHDTMVLYRGSTAFMILVIATVNNTFQVTQMCLSGSGVAIRTPKRISILVCQIAVIVVGESVTGSKV